MESGVQHSLGTTTIHDLERLRDNRYVECLRVGEDPDADVELEYLERLVRDMSIGVNQVVFNLESLAARSGNTFVHPPRPDSLSSMGFVGPLLLATPMSSVRKDGPCVTSAITPSPEELRVVTYDVTASLQGSLDQGIPLPPLPQYPKWYLPRCQGHSTPYNLPGLSALLHSPYRPLLGH